MSDPKPGEWRAFRFGSFVALGEVGNAGVSIDGPDMSYLLEEVELGPPLNPADLMDFVSFTPEPVAFKPSSCFECRHFLAYGSENSDDEERTHAHCSCMKGVWNSFDVRHEEEKGTESFRYQMRRAATCAEFERVEDE